ncbi:hypothetical protein WJX72_011482 [[Myrmecia] bisecta]|uniref:DNA-directed primase/polymerase protein n=1 Tax=[Myrmecia] bisecta TaxID=41462 RepID=A0AAW1RAB9_9CHLO
MPAAQQDRRSLLQCILDAKVAAKATLTKRRKLLKGTLQGSRCDLASAQPAVLHSANAAPDTAAQPSLPTPAITGTLLHVRPSSFYRSWRLDQVDAHVVRWIRNAKRRLRCPDELAIFQHVPLQEAAFQFLDDHEAAPQLRVFSVEHDVSGRRSFIVSTMDEFWKRYSGMLPQHRHYYEIIRQGWPCHLYFDLEFGTGFNPDVNGEQLVDLLLQLVFAKIKDKFGLEVDAGCVLELDSTTPAKFSRHLIVRLPGHAFQNNMHVGTFVKELCEAVVGEQSEGNPYNALMVMKDETGTKTLFVDGGVYSRNRAFRLFLSSKAGRESILRPTGRLMPLASSQRQTFMDALICNVTEGASLLRCADDCCGAFSWTKRGAAAHRPAGGAQGPPADAQAHVGPCPFPELERFIASICTEGGTQGTIRSWMHWPELDVVLFNIKGNRWCGNVGRAHKSNGIFYIADLKGGIWYQKCYDPECRNYRSEAMPLPPHLLARRTSGPAENENPHNVLADGDVLPPDSSHANAYCSTARQTLLRADTLQECSEGHTQQAKFPLQAGRLLPAAGVFGQFSSPAMAHEERLTEAAMLLAAEAHEHGLY